MRQLKILNTKYEGSPLCWLKLHDHNFISSSKGNRWIVLYQSIIHLAK